MRAAPWVALACVTIASAGGIALRDAIDHHRAPPPPTTSVRLAAGGWAIPTSDLRAGDCLSSLPAGDVVAKVPGISCRRTHRIEALGHVAVPSASYPGEHALESQALDLCGQKMRATDPELLDRPSVHLIWLEPTSWSWSHGDRSITCAVALDPPQRGRVLP